MADGGRTKRANPRVSFETTAGTFTALIYLDKMPLSASNFLDLVESGFYEGQHVHRVVPRVGIFLGCPFSVDPASPLAGTGYPPDGSSFVAPDGRAVTRGGGRVSDEFPRCPRLTNAAGTLAMTNLGEPHSGGSQFVVNVGHNRPFDFFDRASPSAHPVFGKIDPPDGLEVVREMALSPATRDAPDDPIAILSVYLGTPEERARAAEAEREEIIRASRRGSSKTKTGRL